MPSIHYYIIISPRDWGTGLTSLYGTQCYDPLCIYITIFWVAETTNAKRRLFMKNRKFLKKSNSDIQLQINLIKGKKRKRSSERSQFSETLFQNGNILRMLRRALNQMKEAWTYKNCGHQKGKSPKWTEAWWEKCEGQQRKLLQLYSEHEATGLSSFSALGWVACRWCPRGRRKRSAKGGGGVGGRI